MGGYKQIAIIAALAEGMAIRQVERMTGVFQRPTQGTPSPEWGAYHGLDY